MLKSFDEFFEKHQIRAIQQQIPGRGEAFKLGTQHAKGKYLVFFSPDGNENPADIPKLVQQIQKRNRDFEFNIKLEYLRNLNEHYETWIGGYKQGKLLVVDVNNLDFVERVEDFSLIVGKIEFELNNLFS